MREIKFRAWDKAEKQMRYLTDIVKLGKSETDRHIHMQFTGLKDKNGKEVYDGDRVSLRFEEAFFSDTIVGEIDWSDSGSGWIVDFPDRGHSILISSLDIDYAQLEVIGNIYESKDLLDNGSDSRIIKK